MSICRHIRKLIGISLLLTPYIVMAWIFLASSYAGAYGPVGVVVQKVTGDSEASRAGLVGGDVISSWSQGNSKGSLNSPFDLLAVERERAPRGTVRLEGVRASSRMLWTLDSANWGLQAAPTWPEIDEIHEHMRELVEKQRFDEIEDYCRLVCVTLAKPEMRGWLLFEAGTWLASASKWNGVDELYQEAVSEARQETSSVGPQMILEQWGQTYLKRQDTVGAEKCFAMALTLNKAKYPRSLAVAYDEIQLALLKYRLNSFSDGADYARQSLAIRRIEVPDSLDTVKAWNTLGVCSLQSGDLDAAYTDLHKALDLALRLNPKGRDASFAYNNLGAVSVEQGDLSKAEDYFLRDLEITRALNPNDYLLSYSWTNLGSIALQRANLVMAQRYFESALAIQEKGERKTDVAKSLHNLAIVAADMSDLTKAEALLRRALDIQERLPPRAPELAQTADTLGSVLRREGKLQESLVLLARALELRKAVNADSLSVAETLYHLGEVHMDGHELGDADEEFRQAAALQRSLASDSYMYANTLAALGRAASLQGNSAAAIQDYSDAIDVLDRQSAMLGGSDDGDIHFHEKYADYYRELVSLLIRQGEVNRAFETLERSRARTLLRMLEEGDIHVKSGDSAALAGKDRRLGRQISDLAEQRWHLASNVEPRMQERRFSAKIVDLLNEREEVRAEMRAQSDRYSALTVPRPIRLLEIQRQLDDETLLLEYSLGGLKSYVFAVTSNSAEWFALPSSKSIESTARRLYRTLSSRDQSRDSLSTDEAELSNEVLDPAKTLIQSHRRLIVVLDGALDYIPFGLLPMGASGELLLTAHDIINCPSASFLVRVRTRSQPRSGYSYDAAILADPVFEKRDQRVKARQSSAALTEDETHGEAPGSPQLPRLLESRKEALKIRNLFQPGRAFTALDFEATNRTMSGSAVRHSRILHLATHGLLDSQNPQLSGLVFSLFDRNGNRERGFYGLEDIFDSDIRAQLVVLSGCRTALGEEVDGEGLLGMTWGFLYAGAQTVVSSLWEVDEPATADLMTAFYEGMIQRHLSPAAALRLAQIQISKEPKWSDPFYWAGFTVEGEWRGRVLERR